MKEKLEKYLKEFRETGIDYDRTLIIQRFINFIVQRERLSEETANKKLTQKEAWELEAKMGF